jgi:hypothetical protein
LKPHHSQMRHSQSQSALPRLMGLRLHASGLSRV